MTDGQFWMAKESCDGDAGLMIDFILQHTERPAVREL